MARRGGRTRGGDHPGTLTLPLPLPLPLTLTLTPALTLTLALTLTRWRPPWVPPACLSSLGSWPTHRPAPARASRCGASRANPDPNPSSNRDPNPNPNPHQVRREQSVLECKLGKLEGKLRAVRHGLALTLAPTLTLTLAPTQTLTLAITLTLTLTLTRWRCSRAVAPSPPSASAGR